MYELSIVLDNGSLPKEFRIRMGLWQGGPMSLSKFSILFKD